MGLKDKRTHYWVDPAFQLRLLVRLGLYFLLFIFAILHVSFFFEVLVQLAANGLGKGIGVLYLDFLGQQRPFLLASVLILPVIFHDMLKFSHRLAGPLYRARQLMRAMAAGKPAPEFTPRKHDLMREFSQAFQALIQEWNARTGAGVHTSLSNGSGAGPVAEAGPPLDSPRVAEAQRV